MTEKKLNDLKLNQHISRNQKFSKLRKNCLKFRENKKNLKLSRLVQKTLLDNKKNRRKQKSKKDWTWRDSQLNKSKKKKKGLTKKCNKRKRRKETKMMKQNKWKRKEEIKQIQTTASKKKKKDLVLKNNKNMMRKKKKMLDSLMMHQNITSQESYPRLH